MLAARYSTRYRCTYHRHLGVTKLAPEILNGVKTNKSSDEETNKLDTAHAANADTSRKQPEEPLRLEALVALVVELGPAEDGGHSAAQQHRVEKDETADGGVRVLAEDHESHKPDSRSAKLELSCGEVGQGNAENTKGGIEDTHDGVVDFLGVFLARLELESTIVSSKNSGETNEHLAQRRVDIEVVFMLDVVTSELAKAA